MTPYDRHTHCQVKQTKAKTRGARGWGGPWRAFVRARGLGTHVLPNLHELSLAYAEVKAAGGEEFALLQRVGAAAALQGRRRPLKHGRSAFGPTCRAIFQQKVQGMRKMHLDGAQHADKEQSTMVVARRLSVSGVSVAACLSLARAALRAEAEVLKKRKQAVEETLAAFRRGPGEDQLAMLHRRVPGLAGEGLVPVPKSARSCVSCGGAADGHTPGGVVMEHRKPRFESEPIVGPRLEADSQDDLS